MSVTPASVKKTQESLGKYVKKPPLTDKLLNKPPFRFLHDVISAVIRETGFFHGLYNEVENKSENVKDKEGKIKFLEKVIDCVSFAIGDQLGAKPSKIVAGQEPQKTNEFLQALAQVIDKKIDTRPFVDRVLKGEKPGAKKQAANNKSGPYNAKTATNNAKNKLDNNTKKKDGSTPRKNSLTGSQGSSNSRENSRSRGNSKSPAKKVLSRQTSKEDQPPTKQNGETDIANGDPQGLQTVIEGNGENGINHDIEPNPPLTNGNHEHKQEEESRSPRTPKTPPKQETPRSYAEVTATEEPAPPQKRSSTSRSRERSSASSRPESRPDSKPDSRPTTGYGKSRTGPDDLPQEPTELKNEEPKSDAKPSQRPGSAMRPRTGRLKSAARPPSARPAAPRLKEKNEIPIEEVVQQRPTTGKVANVIVDDGIQDDDADEFLVEEKPKDNLDLDTENTSVDVNNLAIQNGEHGALVQQILDTQKELEVDNAEANAKRPGGVEIEKDAGFSDFNRQREREATQRDVQKLKDSIQILTRSANPLGKLMDFLQEDVDSMQRELETWRTENKQLQAQLRAEESLTQQSIEPLKVHLLELESAVEEQLDLNSGVKSNILKNDEKIARMVGSIGLAGK